MFGASGDPYIVVGGELGFFHGMLRTLRGSQKSQNSTEIADGPTCMGELLV